VGERKSLFIAIWQDVFSVLLCLSSLYPILSAFGLLVARFGFLVTACVLHQAGIRVFTLARSDIYLD